MRQGLKVNEPGVKLKHKDWSEERVEDEKMLSELQDLQGMNIAVWCLGILVQRSHQLTPTGELVLPVSLSKGERRCKVGLASWQNGQRGLRDEHKLSCATAAAGSEQALIAKILKTQGEIHSACQWRKPKAVFCKISNRASKLKCAGLCSCRMQD